MVLFRKSRDCIYGKCQYKVLRKIISKTRIMYKTWIKARNQEKILLHIGMYDPVIVQCLLRGRCENLRWQNGQIHYTVIIMSAMASQITSFTIVYWTVCSGTDQRKHNFSTSLASVRGSHQWPVDCLHKWPVTRKMFPFDDVIMRLAMN